VDIGCFFNADTPHIRSSCYASASNASSPSSGVDQRYSAQVEELIGPYKLSIFWTLYELLFFGRLLWNGVVAINLAKVELIACWTLSTCLYHLVESSMLRFVRTDIVVALPVYAWKSLMGFSSSQYFKKSSKCRPSIGDDDGRIAKYWTLVTQLCDLDGYSQQNLVNESTTAMICL